MTTITYITNVCLVGDKQQIIDFINNIPPSKAPYRIVDYKQPLFHMHLTNSNKYFYKFNFYYNQDETLIEDVEREIISFDPPSNHSKVNMIIYFDPSIEIHQHLEQRIDETSCHAIEFNTCNLRPNELIDKLPTYINVEADDACRCTIF